MRLHRVVLALAVAALTAACGDGPVGPTVFARLVVGVIDHGGTVDRVLEVPASAVAGEPVTAIVSTFGNTCVSAAGAEVVARDREVTITPYDQQTLVGGCLDSLETYPRTVMLQFDRIGEATVRVRGRGVGSRFVTVERQIMIVPRS